MASSDATSTKTSLLTCTVTGDRRRVQSHKTTPVSETSLSMKRSTLVQYARWYFELTRLHKFPLGNILIIWPCLWGLTMVAFDARLSGTAFASQALMFILGSTLLHSTVCVLNDICDIDLDRQVERTKNRPLALGVIPLAGAWALYGFMTLCCFGLLFLLNSTARHIAIIDLFPLHTLYPLMKRWTYWPQAWLGLAMNWGFLVAWLNVKPNTTTATDWYIMIIMLLGMDCWTIVYDTIYGCQDREDDAKVGVGSTALLFGNRVRSILVGFAAVFVLCLVVAGMLNGQTAVYYTVSCGGATAHLTWQLVTWDVNDVGSCREKFRSNGDLGYFVWAGILLDYLFRA